MKITLVPINLWSYKRMKESNEDLCFCFTVRSVSSGVEEELYIEAVSETDANNKVVHRIRNTDKYIVDYFQIQD